MSENRSCIPGDHCAEPINIYTVTALPPVCRQPFGFARLENHRVGAQVGIHARAPRVPGRTLRRPRTQPKNRKGRS